MDQATWARYSALLDEALDLAPARRQQWLAALNEQDAETATALTGLLQKAEAAEAAIAHNATVPPAFQHWLKDAASAAERRAAGQLFGPWKLLRPLGQGGMGEVWQAARRDGLYEGEAALKFIRSGMAAEQLADRFARERRVLARLNHTGIARLLDAGVADGQPYLVLEYVPGVPLLDHAAAQKAGVAQRVRLLLAAAQAVEHAHGQLVAHRDLKPSNILVTPAGEVKLLDFGIAALLDDEAVEGDHTLTRLTGRALTPGYAAPEQITGEPAGAPADVFALGVLLHQLLSGQRPFAPGETRRAVIEHAVLHEPPQSLRAALAARNAERPADAAVAMGLAPVIAKALQRQPQDRYPSVASLVDDLQRWLDHRPLLAAAAPWHRRTRLWLRRNRIVASATALVLLSLSTGLAAALHQRAAAVRQAERASAMSEYLLDTLSAADPDAPASTPASLNRVLVRAAEGLDTRFADDPESRARLLLRLTTIHNDFNHPEAALVLAEKAWKTHVQTYGSRHVETGWALRHWAETLYGIGHYREAIQRAREALVIAEQQSPVNVELEHDALIMEQFALMKQGRFAKASRVLERYEALVQEHFSNIAIYPALAVQFRGNLLREQGRWAEAQARYAEARQILAPAGKRFWRVMLLIDIELAQARVQLDNPPALRTALAQLVEQSRLRLGSDSRITQTAQAALASSLSFSGEHERALEAWGTLTRGWWQPGAPSHPLLLRAQAEWLAARWQLGEPAESLQAELLALHDLLLALPEPSTDALHAETRLAALAEASGQALLAETQRRRIETTLAGLGDDAIALRTMLAAESRLR